MARKSRIPRSKIRVRAFFRRFAEMEVGALDRFRGHVRDTAAAQRRSIEKRADRLPAEPQEFLADELHELDAISDLADQLAIVALYRIVEINTGRILAHKFGTAAQRKASSIAALRDFLGRQGLKIDSVPHFSAVNELRLLNNAIKHAGRVTTELANEFPRWKQGQELTGLGAAYKRLEGRVPSYIFRLAEGLKLRFK